MFDIGGQIVGQFEYYTPEALTPVLRWRGKGESFAELLGRPHCRRKLHNLEMQHPSAMMAKDQENIEHLKIDGGNG